MQKGLPPPLEPIVPRLLDNRCIDPHSAHQKASRSGSPIQVAPKKLVANLAVPLVIPEVQRAMGRDWMTHGLMSSVGSNPELVNSMNDEEFQSILALMKADPVRARAALEGNERLAGIFRTWASTLGEHFETLATEESDALERSVKRGVGNSNKDPDVQQLISFISNGGKVDPRELSSRNPRLFKKVERLIRNGKLCLNV